MNDPLNLQFGLIDARHDQTRRAEKMDRARARLSSLCDVRPSELGLDEMIALRNSVCPGKPINGAVARELWDLEDEYEFIGDVPYRTLHEIIAGSIS